MNGNVLGDNIHTEEQRKQRFINYTLFSLFPLCENLSLCVLNNSPRLYVKRKNGVSTKDS